MGHCVSAHGWWFTRGDVNGDLEVDVADAVDLLFVLYGGESTGCADAADVNDDGTLNITDPIALLGHLFLGEEPPKAPYPVPGTDPTPDGLECLRT